MEPAKIEQWQRFRAQVLRHRGWPRDLWFVALEDGLRATFGEESQLLADLRRDRAELLRLERRASGSYQDERRIGQLEAQIRQLADLADRRVSGGQPDLDEPPAAAPAARSPAVPSMAPPARPRRTGWGAPAAALAAGALLFALGLGLAGVYYETRMAAQADQQLARIDRLLDARMAGLRAEVDRRLAADSDGAGELRGRAAALGRALDQLGLDVSSLQMRLPTLDRELEQITAGTARMADELARAGAEIEALQTATPELAARLVRQQEALEQDVQERRDSLDGVTASVHGLADQVDQSRALLTGLNRSLVVGLEQARRDGEALQTTVDEMRATGLEVSKLMDGAEISVQAAQTAMQQKIDRILADLAEQADLAVLRGQDVVDRAEGAVARRVEAASATALDAAAQEHAAQLAALAEQIAATRAELERTRAGLLAGWQRMDQRVAERQDEVLTSLDGYAGTIGVRVEELLQALDVMVARSGG